LSKKKKQLQNGRSWPEFMAKLNMKWAGPVHLWRGKCHKTDGEKESATQFPYQKQENIYLGKILQSYGCFERSGNTL